MYPSYNAWQTMPLMHGLGFLFFFPILAILLLWTLVIKGIALWYAARNGQKGWFIALLIINTLGILELIYLFGFRADRPKAHSVISDKNNTPPASSSPVA